MSERVWSDVDSYIDERLIGPDPVLQAALRDSAAAGLPSIAVTAAQGKMLHLLARIHGARRILEVGTLGGYSTIWLGRALPPDGRLITLELNPAYAQVASVNIDRAALGGSVEVIVGPAGESLRGLLAGDAEPFDLVFIDADKKSTPEYFAIALEMSRPGTVIVVDNVVRDGALIDADSSDSGVQGMRVFHDLLAGDARVSATTIQTVGGKGYDGFTLVLVDQPARTGPGG